MKYTKEFLEPLVATSDSVAEVVRKIGIKPGGGAQTNISNRIKQFELDTSHFLGKKKGWALYGRSCKKQWFEVLVKRDGTTRRQEGSVLTKALLESGREYVCVDCGNTGEWRGSPLTLDVDHIDGDWMNDSPENLRFVCPNCHRVTPNWGRKTRT